MRHRRGELKHLHILIGDDKLHSWTKESRGRYEQGAYDAPAQEVLRLNRRSSLIDIEAF
jgi:hypothetical protein